MLNLKHLYYFHVFAQELSTTNAAKKLLISAPALSNQLKQLEEFLGTPLTRRKHNRVEITEAGEIVQNYTEQMFSAYEGLKTKIASLRNDKKSRFRAGFSLNLGARFSFDLLCLLERTSLTLSDSVEITFAGEEELTADFQKGRYDLILGAFDAKEIEESSLVSQLLSFPVRLFASRSLGKTFSGEKFPAGSELFHFVELANAKKIPMIIPARPTVLRAETDRALAIAKARPARTIECNSSQGIVQLIERGFGFALVPTPCLLDFKSASFLAVLGPVQGFWRHSISAHMLKGGACVARPIPRLETFFSEP